MKYFLAIDLGASSGRHVIGYLNDNNEIILDEVHRFRTEMDDSPSGLIWDIPRIFNEIKIGIKKAFLKYKEIESLSIDTWGVDYVLLNNDKEITPYYAYRNDRTILSKDKVHEIIPFKDLYMRTGIQYAQFNTIYQLYDDKIKGRLDNATDYLMLPSYFTYKLTGIKTHEYTNESTTSLLNPFTKEYDYELIEKLGLPKNLFKEIAKPGDFIGCLSKEIEEEVGGNTKVILCASHDTASAFNSIETDSDSIILSSGTWSLLGIKSKEAIVSDNSLDANYTNEGGIDYIRFLKNIMGMYIVNRLRSELHIESRDLDDSLNISSYNEVFDVNDKSLLAPVSMYNAINDLLKHNPPKSNDDLFKSVFNSLALSYKNSILELESITQRTYSKLYILGGGANRKELNKLIEKYTGKKVIALPIEATSLGNINIQIKEYLKNEKRS